MDPIYLEQGVDRYLVYWQLGATGSRELKNDGISNHINDDDDLK